MVNKRTVVLGCVGIEQVTISENFRPRGKVISDDTVTILRQRLGNARRAGEAVEHSAWLHLLDELQDVGQQLEL